MNEELSTYARKFLKENIPKCSEGEIHVFKMMYSPVNPQLDIDKVIDQMPDEKLDWAMSQVNNTMKKVKKDETDNGGVRSPEEKG